jgi:hypothetical protein
MTLYMVNDYKYTIHENLPWLKAFLADDFHCNTERHFVNVLYISALQLTAYYNCILHIPF